MMETQVLKCLVNLKIYTQYAGTAGICYLEMEIFKLNSKTLKMKSSLWTFNVLYVGWLLSNICFGYDQRHVLLVTTIVSSFPCIWKHQMTRDFSSNLYISRVTLGMLQVRKWSTYSLGAPHITTRFCSDCFVMLRL